MTLLSIDFDGVLHPHHAHFALGDMRSATVAQVLEAGLFVHRQLLADLLEPFPCVRVVVHSSWRKVLDMNTLRHVLEPLRPRLVGMTPPDVDDREASVLAFLRRRRVGAECVVILDDQPLLFKQLRPRVVACDPVEGIASRSVQKRLATALSDLKGART